MEPGYIYVLINPSLEGLVKIGKTSRDPKTRAAELSSATGVPTPFIVAYEEHFTDITVAETFLHTLLEERGHRVSDNREFFDADLKDVILAIQNAKESLDTDDIESSSQRIVCEAENQKGSSLADDLVREAISAQYGEFEDHDEAVRLYKQATKLGNAIACRFLGQMYRTKYRFSKQKSSTYQLNNKEALKFFKLGAERGDTQCYAYMAEVYEEYSEFGNSLACWNNFFGMGGFRDPHNPSPPNTINADPDEILEYIHLAWTMGEPIRHQDKLIGILKGKENKETEIDELIVALENGDHNALKRIFSSEWWINILDFRFGITYGGKCSDPYFVKEKAESTYKKQIEGSTGCLVIIGFFFLLSGSGLTFVIRTFS